MRTDILEGQPRRPKGPRRLFRLGTLAALLVAVLFGCGDTEHTGIDLQVTSDSELGLDRLSISVHGEGGERIGDPQERPDAPRALQAVETVLILLAEELAETTVIVRVRGLRGEEAVDEAEVEVPLRAGVLAAASIELLANAPDCGGDDGCDGGAFCVDGVCRLGCRIDGAFFDANDDLQDEPCLVCDPARSSEEWSSAAEGSSCGAEASCDDQGRCVPDAPSDFLLQVAVGGEGSGTVKSDDELINCSSEGGACSASYELGASVILSAQAGEQSRLMSWEGGGCSGSFHICQVQMTANRQVTATFDVSDEGSCQTPWGARIADGDAVDAYAVTGQTCCPNDPSCCWSETRRCENGVLGGSFQDETCAPEGKVGLTCPDGTTYVGLFESHHYYTTASDLPWECAQETELCGSENLDCHAYEHRWDCPPWDQPHEPTGADSTSDGAHNTALLVGDAWGSRHSAAFRCANMQANERGDWFLPAIDELNLLHLHRAYITGLALQNCAQIHGGSNATCSYWSSTETNADNAMAQILATGQIDSGAAMGINKPHTFFVRCMRREPAP